MFVHKNNVSLITNQEALNEVGRKVADEIVLFPGPYVLVAGAILVITADAWNPGFRVDRNLYMSMLSCFMYPFHSAVAKD